MSGMGSTLQLNNPTVVAALQSALIHQGIITLLIFLLALLWVSLREWAPGGRTSFRPAAGALPARASPAPDGGANLAAAPGGGFEALIARGDQLSRLGPVHQRFRVDPVAGHQRGHSLRLVRVSWVL